MAIDFANMVYAPAYNVFARTVVFYPLRSQPAVTSFGGRGIYNTEAMDVLAEEGTIVSDQRTILDILENEFSTLPIQGDELVIPSDGTLPAIGRFEIIETKSNGGGETTMILRKVVAARP